MKEDRQLLVLTHLSQLLTAITGFGGLIVPLIIWFSKKDENYQIDEQGKKIINFQLSLIVNFIICIPLILLFGLGIAFLLALFVYFHKIKYTEGFKRSSAWELTSVGDDVVFQHNKSYCYNYFKNPKTV